MALTQQELKKCYIRVDEQGWQPGANTVAYYPLEEDGNDYSGNSHNLTWTSTPTYTTSGGTKQVVSLDGSTLGKIANLAGIYTNYTFNVWCKLNSTGTWQELFDNYQYIGDAVNNSAYFGYNSSEDFHSDFFYQYRPNGGTNPYERVYGNINRVANVWYNVCLVSTGSGVKIYVNGLQTASNSTTGSIVLVGGYNSIGGRWSNDENLYKNCFNGYLSEFIIEDKVRTVQEISNYYNDTKLLYGIS